MNYIKQTRLISCNQRLTEEVSNYYIHFTTIIENQFKFTSELLIGSLFELFHLNSYFFLLILARFVYWKLYSLKYLPFELGLC